jgi:hypothetical protein
MAVLALPLALWATSAGAQTQQPDAFFCDFFGKVDASQQRKEIKSAPLKFLLAGQKETVEENAKIETVDNGGLLEGAPLSRFSRVAGKTGQFSIMTGPGKGRAKLLMLFYRPMNGVPQYDAILGTVGGEEKFIGSCLVLRSENTADDFRNKDFP